MTMDLGLATKPKRGESVNGDACFIGEYEGAMLLAVIDGLGHGELANTAAAKAASFLASHLHLDPVALMTGCHQALRGSRGAVIGLASIDQKNNVISYVGVGNIESRVVREEAKVLHLISRNGIVGCNMGNVKNVQHPYRTGDTLMMFSDGISSRLDLFEFLPTQDLQSAAERILEKHGKDDDATVLLARL